MYSSRFHFRDAWVCCGSCGSLVFSCRVSFGISVSLLVGVGWTSFSHRFRLFSFCSTFVMGSIRRRLGFCRSCRVCSRCFCWRLSVSRFSVRISASWSILFFPSVCFCSILIDVSRFALCHVCLVFVGRGTGSIRFGRPGVQDARLVLIGSCNFFGNMETGHWFLPVPIVQGAFALCVLRFGGCFCFFALSMQHFHAVWFVVNIGVT